MHFDRDDYPWRVGFTHAFPVMYAMLFVSLAMLSGCVASPRDLNDAWRQLSVTERSYLYDLGKLPSGQKFNSKLIEKNTRIGLPESSFKTQMLNGTVVQDMCAIEVLHAWGYPSSAGRPFLFPNQGEFWKYDCVEPPIEVWFGYSPPGVLGLVALIHYDSKTATSCEVPQTESGYIKTSRH